MSLPKQLKILKTSDFKMKLNFTFNRFDRKLYLIFNLPLKSKVLII